MEGISRIDHVAMTVADIETTREFYDRLFGAVVQSSYEVDGRLLQQRISIGRATLSLHQLGNGIELVADKPTPGSTDICFGWDGTIEAVVDLLDRHGIAIIVGPAPRETTDMQPGQSVYFRDPDNNLIEIMAAKPNA